MSTPKKIGLITCMAVVAGNMMGSGIALLPASLAKIGSIAIWGWVVAMIGAMALAYVYARLATKNPQEGGPIAYAGEVAPILGHQTSVMYYHANWIGNLAIAITAVAYASSFFPILNDPIPAAIASIAMVWLFTFVNLLGGAWVSRLTSIGLILVLIPVIGTAVFGWSWFDITIYKANWIADPSGDSNKAIINSVLLCLWAFVGVESAAVSSGLVDNPTRTVPLATIGGTLLAGIVYILASQVIAGMFPNAEVAGSGAPFALSASKMVGDWAIPFVSAFTAIACLTSLGSWMMLVGQAGRRAAADGNFPKLFGETDKNGVPKKGLIVASIMMTALMVILTVLSASGSNAADLFTQLTSIAVMLTMFPYFYSAIDLIRFEGMTTKSLFSLVASVLAILFCFIALAGAEHYQITATIIVSLAIFAFYARKMGNKQKQEQVTE
ncbi:cadaverine/lysine antiporter [Morganella morganii]|uniref:cadaverine/lysine antiporter n=1 Tax=Morganella morganii TaxID=582 RepID=UPI000D1EABF7|nr:cadaverine/lysine antiporter [Morganella morganii]HAE78339.1 lysine:cadaverine antiporter [Morganella sp. (in: enterobacteria)]QXO50831.1 cadaverine/lysine antiporter [Morganella morganii]QXO54697.1 cadaverine/lysine antiporter [Morganella morganii]QXO58562.1 cadaverine/lysine antiporter [Morganella morganii]QXO69854.1 cadaverine/lysine antiporter [Morganella morganii]